MSSNIGNQQPVPQAQNGLRGSGPRLPPQTDQLDGQIPPAFYTDDQTSAQRSGFLPKPAIALLSIIAMACYLVLWLLSWIFSKKWFEASVDCSEDWSKVGGYWTVHFWLFSKPLYYFWYAIIPLLLLVTPRRISSLKSILIIFISIYTNEHLRWWVGEARPLWVTNDIVQRESCDCSFGKPSWEGHHAFLLWAFFVYEFVLHTQHINKVPKFLWIGGISFIVINIAIGRVFYGQNTWIQAFLGVLHGGFWFGVMTLLNDKFNAFFDGVLGSKAQNRIILMGAGAGLFVLNTVLFYSWYNVNKGFKVEYSNCHKCFENRNEALRRKHARCFAFTNMLLGIVVGLGVVNPIHTGINEFMHHEHFSLKGAKRLLIMVVLHVPLIFITLFTFSPANTYWYESLFFILTGFLITFVDITLNNKLNLNIQGDIVPEGRELALGGGEGMSLLDGRDPTLTKSGKHFNPYDKLAARRDPNNWDRRAPPRE